MRARIHSKHLLLFILLFAFGVRLAVARYDLNVALRPDERAYMARADLVATNVWKDHKIFRPPFYPYTVALLYKLIGKQRFAVSVLQVLLDTVSTALMFALTQTLLSKLSISTLAALLFAISPQSIGFAGSLFAEPLFICLFLAGLLVVVRGIRRSSAAATVAGGVLLALAALTREAGAYFALIVVPGWWLLFSGQRLQARLAGIALFLLGMGLVLAPWVVRNYNVTHGFLMISTSGAFDFSQKNLVVDSFFTTGARGKKERKRVDAELAAETAPLPLAARATYMYQRGLNVIRKYGLYWLGYKAEMVGAFWHLTKFDVQKLAMGAVPEEIRPTASLLIIGYLMGLAVFATLGIFAAPDDSLKLLVGLFVLYSLLLFVLTHYQLRYRYPVHVLLTPFAAYGLWVVSRLAGTRRFDPQWITARRLLLAAVTFACFVPLIA